MQFHNQMRLSVKLSWNHGTPKSQDSNRSVISNSFFGVSLMKFQRGWYPTCIHYQCNLHQSHPSNKMRYPVYMIIYVSSTTESIWPYETLFGWLWWFWMCIPWTHIHTMACNIFFFLIRLGETHQISWFRLVVNHRGCVKTIQNHSKPHLGG